MYHWLRNKMCFTILQIKCGVTRNRAKYACSIRIHYKWLSPGHFISGIYLTRWMAFILDICSRYPFRPFIRPTGLSIMKAYICRNNIMRLKRRPLRLRLEIMELYDWKEHAQMRRGEDAKAKTRSYIRSFAFACSPYCLHLLVFTSSHFRISRLRLLTSRLRTFKFPIAFFVFASSRYGEDTMSLMEHRT